MRLILTIRNWWWLVAILVLLPEQVRGQAYCSLRDPNRIVQELFPDATGFRSFMRRVTREDATSLSRELEIDFDPREFTTHTLYAVYQDGTILGFLQSRTEAVDWGLAEIIWVLDADLNLATFRFQRCRSRHREAAESQSVQAQLKGLSEKELLRLREDHGATWLVEQAGLPKSATVLADAILKSGLKATGLARVVWGADIAKLKSSYPQATND